MDSLVFMLAGLLLPAWLLGHLFLTFYPAPETMAESGTEPKSNLENPAESSDLPSGLSPTDSSGDAANDSNPGDSNGMLANNPLKGELDSLTGKFNSLVSKSTQLETDIATLNRTNADLMAENAALKSEASDRSNSNSLMLQEDSASVALVNELRTKFDSASRQVTAMEQSLQDARSQLETTESEKQTLQLDLDNARMKLQQAETKLASAQTTDSMEIKPEGGNSPFAHATPEGSSSKPDLVAEANARVAELEQKIKEINFSLTNANQTAANRQKDLQARESEIQSTRQNMEDLRAQTAQVIADLRTQNNDLKTALEASRNNPVNTLKVVEPQLPKEVYRDFISSKGSVSKMAFIRWEGEDIIVRSFSNKKLYRLTLDRFSNDDQQYLLERK